MMIAGHKYADYHKPPSPNDETFVTIAIMLIIGVLVLLAHTL